MMQDSAASEVISLPPLRMIEKHFRGDALMATYDFSYSPVLAPSCRNVWEFTYDMPKLSKEHSLCSTTARKPCHAQTPLFILLDSQGIGGNAKAHELGQLLLSGGRADRAPQGLLHVQVTHARHKKHANQIEQKP